MAVIAMTREMGTRGKDVAAGLADTLGLEVVHHELVERHLAERLNTKESTVHRFLEGEASMWERWSLDSKRLSRFTAEEILERAERGNVLIRGWGAAQLLSDVQHVICVRIYAAMSVRITEMMRRLKTTNPNIARHEIERNDLSHARTIQHQFARDWRDPDSYDIMLNSGRVPIDACVGQIRLLADHPNFAPTDASRARLTDKVIEARVRTALDTENADMTYGGNLDVEVRAGDVVLTGVTTDGVNLQKVVSSLAKVKGVVSVTNEVHVARYGV